MTAGIIILIAMITVIVAIMIVTTDIVHMIVIIQFLIGIMD